MDSIKTEEQNIDNAVDENILSIALQKVKGLFFQVPAANYMEGFQLWLKDRMKDWENTALRIGVVGITSAGKSTFVNALAGEDILPRGAQPTSGVLVVCRKSKERNLTILFKDENKDSFSGEDCNAMWVSRYADEAQNPSNEQNVKEIQLSLPGMMIPEKYDLIDSPGLDAFGLQGHEELTLRTLIPLVDVVLFLTTTKSSSDRENLRALSKICKEAKPAIVIQTHKDSVEPHYTKGGKIVETCEDVLQKHYHRVKQLLEQTSVLQDAPIIQVSSIQALNARSKNPQVSVDQIPEWEESGFSQITEVLAKLYQKLSQKVSLRRLKLIQRELDQLYEQVRSDYNMARGQKEEALEFKKQELQKLDDLQNRLPTEKHADFPDIESLQSQVQEIKDLFMAEVESRAEENLESLSIEVRDKIKSIESLFFEKADKMDQHLQSLADILGIDVDAVQVEEQRHPTLPQLQRYEKLVKVEVVEQIGMVGVAKRIFGKILNKEKWGFKEKEVLKSCINRDALREDLLDYHSIYSLKLSNYLKRWKNHFVNTVAAILTAISHKKDDLNKEPIQVHPEKYSDFLNKIREVKDWLSEKLQSDQKHFTMRISTLRKSAQQSMSMTQKTQSKLNLFLPLLQAARTIHFTRKTHRFWYVVQRMLKEFNDCPMILVSTPFSQEIFRYFGLIGDLPEVEEKDFLSHPVIYNLVDYPMPPKFGISFKQFSSFPEDSRESWFLQRNSILMIHDAILSTENGLKLFEYFADRVDVIFRVVDLHQIGHEKKRLEELPVNEKLQKKSNLGYIGLGANQLVKSGQAVDIYKSYSSLEKWPGFGLKPLLLAEGEDLLNSLLWLSESLTKEHSVAEEMAAMEILNKTQSEFIQGQETFIRHFFNDLKDFKRERSMMQELTS